MSTIHTYSTYITYMSTSWNKETNKQTNKTCDWPEFICRFKSIFTELPIEFVNQNRRIDKFASQNCIYAAHTHMYEIGIDNGARYGDISTLG